MGGGHHSSNTTHITDNITKHINSTTNNHLDNTTTTNEHNLKVNNLNGDQVIGGQLKSTNTANAGTAIYALQNLDTLNHGAQVFGKLPNGINGHQLYNDVASGGNAYTALGIKNVGWLLI